MGVYNSFLGKRRILQYMADHPASQMAFSNRILTIGRRWGFLYIRIFGYPPVVATRLLARKILCLLKKEKRGLLLDVGCSLGTYSFELARIGFTVVGIDVNRDSIHLAEKIQMDLGMNNVTFWEMDILSNNFPEETFRVIIALETLEHIKEDSRVIQEFKRILKHDGILIISVPFREKVEEYDEPRGACRTKDGSLICIGEGGGHFRNGYNLSRMKALLENNGFSIIDYEYLCIPKLLNASILSFPFKYPLSLFFSPLSKNRVKLKVTAQKIPS